MTHLAPSVSIAMASLCLCTSCGADENGCDDELREASLDAKVGGETPRQVIELLERPVSGVVTWHSGGSDEIEVSGATGTSTFVAQAFAEPTVWQRGGYGARAPNERLYCPTELVFDVAVHVETEDSALNEDWQGPGTYTVSDTPGGGGPIDLTIEDPPPFAGTLQVTELPAAARWESREIDIQLSFTTYPLDVTGLRGSISYSAENDDEQGDAHEILGVRTTIAELSVER